MIDNRTDDRVRKYGHYIEPQSSFEYDAEVVLAYSAMEISRALQYINMKLGNIDRRQDNEAFYAVQSYMHPKPQHVYIQNFEDMRLHDPWLVRKYKEWKAKRVDRKRMQELTKEWKKNPPNVI